MLRRRRSDPPFLRANLEAGLKAGAALEIDVVVTADGDFVCLHDLTLDSATTGTGPVRERTRAEIAELRQRGSNGEALDSPPLFLNEVAATTARLRRPDGGLVQIDIKDPATGYEKATVERFRGALAGTGEHFIIGGLDWPLVETLADAAGTHRGFDPLTMYPRGGPDTALGFESLAENTLKVAPGAEIYYLEAALLLKGLLLGVNLVERVAGSQVEVDAWTVNAGSPDLAERLRQLVDAGVDQITTDDADELEPMLRELV